MAQDLVSIADAIADAVRAHHALDLPGTSGHNASTPDAAALDITGDVEVVVDVTLDDWTPADQDTLYGDYSAAGGFELALRESTVGLQFAFVLDADGTTQIAIRTWTQPADGSRKRLKVTRASATGTVTFYQSDDGVTFSQIGATVATTAGAMRASPNPKRVGTRADGTTGPAAGLFHAVTVRSGIAGTVVASPDFDQLPGVTSFTDDQGNVWTVNGASSAFVFNGTGVQDLHRTYAYLPSSIAPPVAVVGFPEVTYDVATGIGHVLRLPVHLAVGRADDRASYAEAAPYLLSVKRAIEVDQTLDGTCKSVRVTSARVVPLDVNGQAYLSIAFDVEVYATL